MHPVILLLVLRLLSKEARKKAKLFSVVPVMLGLGLLKMPNYVQRLLARG